MNAITSVLREKKKEQEREELWRKLDELRLQETSAIQNNRREIQFTCSNNNNNNNNLHEKNENPAAAITDRIESDSWVKWHCALSSFFSIVLVYRYNKDRDLQQ